MVIRETLFPGEVGTEELVEKYGERLVCVRLRHDKVREKQVRTAEIIMDEGDWPDERLENGSQVLVRIEADESDIRAQIEAVGGSWSPNKKGWRMNYRKALQIGVEKRIVH